MPEITAAAVKALREKTNLPMMDCKKALEATGGDPEKAVQYLREQGKKTYESKAGSRETSFGRVAVYLKPEANQAAMVEMLCESAPVVSNEGFMQLVNDAAQQLATGPGAAAPAALMGQASPSSPGHTLQDQLDALYNQIREVFRLNRIVRIDAPCAGYIHHNAAVGVLLEVGGTVDAALAKDICMHIAAMSPKVVSPAEMDQAAVETERNVLREAARAEGKPEKILDKMVEGRMRDFYAQHCLSEQPFVKDPAKTVGQVAAEAGMKLVRFVHWQLGKE